MRKEVAQVDRVWSAIAEGATHLLKKGMDVSEIISTLRSIRTFINLYDTHVAPDTANLDGSPCITPVCCSLEMGARIRCELRNLEDRLVIKAANELGIETATELSNKLLRAWKA